MVSETIRIHSKRGYYTIVRVRISYLPASKDRRSFEKLVSFYELGMNVINDSVGEVFKFLDDGLLAVFPADQATNAVKAAVTLDESFNNDVDIASPISRLAIGISTGPGQEISAKSVTDFIGSVADTATRLCDISSPGAILLDAPTYGALEPSQVSSKVGRACSPARSFEEYLGDEMTAEAPGSKSTLSFHELKWSDKVFGAQFPQSSVRPSTADAVDRSADVHDAPNQVHAGTVRRWDSTTGRGFLAGDDGVFYYVDRRFLADGQDLEHSAKAFFVVRPPLVAGKNQVAAAVVQLGQLMRGRVSRMIPKKGYGFVAVQDELSNQMNMLLVHSDEAAVLSSGDLVEFSVTENTKGPVGLGTRKIVQSEESAREEGHDDTANPEQS